MQKPGLNIGQAFALEKIVETGMMLMAIAKRNIILEFFI